MSADPRSRAQRRRDAEHRLTHDVDVWVASASADDAPYLVPLSFDWDGEAPPLRPLAAEHIELERTRILEGEDGVTHMHYRVQR